MTILSYFSLLCHVIDIYLYRSLVFKNRVAKYNKTVIVYIKFYAFYPYSFRYWHIIPLNYNDNLLPLKFQEMSNFILQLSILCIVSPCYKRFRVLAEMVPYTKKHVIAVAL